MSPTFQVYGFVPAGFRAVGLHGAVTFSWNWDAMISGNITLFEALIGPRLTVAEAHGLFDEFHHMLTGGAEEQGVELGKLSVFEGVREYPVRVKCATLAWHTLNAAMEDRDDPVSTE